MSEKEIFLRIIDILVKEKVNYSLWNRIKDFIDGRYATEVKKSTIKDTPKT